MCVSFELQPRIWKKRYNKKETSVLSLNKTETKNHSQLALIIQNSFSTYQSLKTSCWKILRILFQQEQEKKTQKNE